MTTLVDSRERLFTAGPDLGSHLRRHGPLPWQGGQHRLIAAVEAAGLTGRGGAGFPTWRKLNAVAAGEKPVVIANGAEGEPASAKDRTLLHRAPHLVLDGLQLAAECVGATRAYVYVPAGPAADAVRHALAQRRAARVDRIGVDVVVAADRFVAGEASAVVSAVEGRARVPRRSQVRSWPPSAERSPPRASTSCPTGYPSTRRSPGPAGRRYPCRLFSWVVTTARGCRRRPAPRRCRVRAFGRGAPRPAPESWWRCRPTGAAWSNPPASPRTSARRPPGSAAPVSTACRGWPTRCTGWPRDRSTPACRPRSPGCRRSSTGAAPASTPTAPCGSSAPAWPPSRPRSASTWPETAATEGVPDEPPAHRLDRMRRARRLRRTAARVVVPRRMGLPPQPGAGAADPRAAGGPRPAGRPRLSPPGPAPCRLVSPGSS